MNPLNHIERHIIDAALRGEPVRRPTMADAAKYEVDARRCIEPLPHVAGGVSARQITGTNSEWEEALLPRFMCCPEHARSESGHLDVSSQTGGGSDGSPPIFGRNVWMALALALAADVVVLWVVAS